MKKYFILTLILLLQLNVIGQTEEASKTDKQPIKYNLGVKAGLNISNLSYSGGELDVSSKSGFFAGVMAEFSFSSKFSLQPEVLYSQQGAKTTYSNKFIENSDYQGTIKLDYINIPLIAKYYLAKGVSIQAGPQIGVLVNAKNNYKDNFFGYENEDEFDLSDYTHSLDTSINLGLGYQYNNTFYIDTRYNISLSDVFEDGKADNYLDLDMANRVFQISIGYFF